MRKSISISISLMPDALDRLDKIAAMQHSTRSKCLADLIWSASLPKGVMHNGKQSKSKKQ